MNKAKQAHAEAVADKLRDYSARIDELSWALDTALSAVEKDKAGYRTGNAANRTGGANSVPGEVEAALAEAETFLIRVGELPPPEKVTLRLVAA